MNRGLIALLELRTKAVRKFFWILKVELKWVFSVLYWGFLDLELGSPLALLLVTFFSSSFNLVMLRSVFVCFYHLYCNSLFQFPRKSDSFRFFVVLCYDLFRCFEWFRWILVFLTCLSVFFLVLRREFWFCIGLDLDWTLGWPCCWQGRRGNEFKLISYELPRQPNI